MPAENSPPFLAKAKVRRVRPEPDFATPVLPLTAYDRDGFTALGIVIAHLCRGTPGRPCTASIRPQKSRHYALSGAGLRHDVPPSLLEGSSMTPLAPRLGRVLVWLASAALLSDGLLQLASPPSMIEAMKHIGYPPDFGPRLSMITLACAILLAIPATRFIGAVLMTGFLGGAIAVHVPSSGFGAPPQFICVAIGVTAWVGLLLSDARVLSSLRRSTQESAMR